MATAFIAESQQDQIISDLFAAGNYLALVSTAPTAIDGTGLVEIQTPGSNGYARQAIGGANAATTAGSGPTALRQATNAGGYTFGAATADWGTAVGIAVYSASTGGTLKGYGDLTASKTVSNGDSLTIAAGSLTAQA